MSEDARAALGQALAWLEQGRRVALATVVATWGSSPRPAGSQLVVSDEGRFVGSVSGGCVEGAVVQEGLDAMQTGRPRVVEFGVSDDQAWEVGLACGGRVRIYVEAVGAEGDAAAASGRASPLPGLRHTTLSALLEALSAKRAAVLVTWLDSGRHRLCYGDRDLDADVDDVDLAAAVRTALHTDSSRAIPTAQGEAFVQVFNPPLRMIVIGAVHIAQSLAPMAAMAGYEVTVVDPRAAFASDARFPGVSLLHIWPDEALRGLAPDNRTAVVALSHDPKLDDPALQAALASEAFYVGALGSRKTHRARLSRLAAQGLPGEALARIHAPIGEPIGATSPSEIAIAIMAQVTRVLRAGALP